MGVLRPFGHKRGWDDILAVITVCNIKIGQILQGVCSLSCQMYVWGGGSLLLSFHLCQLFKILTNWSYVEIRIPTVTKYLHMPSMFFGEQLLLSKSASRSIYRPI